MYYLLNSGLVRHACRIKVTSIVFHGKIISKAFLGKILFGLWVIYAAYYVCCALHIARRNKARSAQQRYLTQEIEELKVKATTDPMTGCRNRT